MVTPPPERGSSSFVEKPVRMVQPVKYGDNYRWHVVVRQGEATRVRALAKIGKVITENDVHSWRAKYTQWPKEFPSGVFSEMLEALNVLRVTRSLSVSQYQSLSPERRDFAERITRVKDAIDTLASELPDMVSAFARSGRYSFEEITRLASLAEGSRVGRGVINTTKARAKEAPWHETVKLLNWYLQNLLLLTEATYRGLGATGPIVMVIKQMLFAAEEPHVTEQAISKALLRSPTMPPGGMLSIEEINVKGYTPVA
jgi:hypothetical protein